MLNKLIIHLKNIIFFKIIIFASSFLLLILFLNISRQALNAEIEAKGKHQKAFDFLQENYLILKDNQELILNNRNTDKNKNILKELQNLFELNFFFDLNKFKEQFASIAKQHQIPENIDFQMITYPNSSYGSVNYGNIMLNNSVLKLSFAFQSLDEFKTVVEKIRGILPFGAKLTTIDIFFNQPIHQESFANGKLDPKNTLAAKLEILLTEMSYE